MIGFPRHIATQTDFENLLSNKKYKKRALRELERLQDFDDRMVTRAVEPINPDDPETEWVTEEISNPYPLHKQKGFTEWMDIVKMNSKYTTKSVEQILVKYETPTKRGGVK